MYKSTANLNNLNEVQVTYSCGHIVVHLSPSVVDPAGIWSDLPKDADGVIRTSDFQECFQCRAKVRSI
jgi:hypothetical protein